jgi:hypothetical protein
MLQDNTLLKIVNFSTLKIYIKYINLIYITFRYFKERELINLQYLILKQTPRQKKY